MNDKKLVSVVIPAYNRENTIIAAIESALSQDVPNIEIIVVDDGSTDGTRQVVANASLPNVVYFYQNNSGANVARNHGIQKATGKYIALLDSDDIFLPGHLNNALSILNDKNDSVVYSQVLVDRGDGKQFVKPSRSIQEGEHMSEYLICSKGFLQTSTLVMPASIAKSTSYLEWLPYGQDVDFALRLSQKNLTFHMQPSPSVVWKDYSDSGRISAKSNPAIREKWLSEARDLMTPRAKTAYTGWYVAKSYAESGQRLKGLRLTTTSILKGAYTPKYAIIIFLQVLLAGGPYRKLSDFIIALKSGKLVKS